MKKLTTVVVILAAVILIGLYFSQESAGVQDENKPWQHGVVKGTGPEHFDNCVVTGYDFTKVTTVGESSFIPIGMHGFPENNPKLILDIVDKFRERVYSLRATWRIQINSYTGEISGIWVEHNTIFPELIRD